jgi:Ala-tRNA(Pro) deacylase
MTDKEKRQEVLERLSDLEIPFELYEHTAVYTMKDIADGEENFPEGSVVVKNLFLKEHNSEKYFLVVTTGEKHADIKSLRRFLGTKPLSFATEAQLEEKLGVCAGAVSPLAVINDGDGTVSLIIDDELKGKLLGVHPNENTATVFITYENLEKYAESCGKRLINMQV